MPVQVDGVRLGDFGGGERAADLRHELSEDADAAVPEGGLRQAPGRGPAARRRVERLHHVRQLERVVVTPGDVQFTAQRRHTASYMDLDERHKIEKKKMEPQQICWI